MSQVLIEKKVPFLFHNKSFDDICCFFNAIWDYFFMILCYFVVLFGMPSDLRESNFLFFIRQ